MFNTGKATMPVASSPCYECPDRFIGDGKTCHSTCEKYKDFKEERIELNKEIRLKARTEKNADAVIINGIQKRRNKANNRKPPVR